MLKLRYTRISHTHHRFEYTRDDGTGESLELDTKTFLFHDLLHFAVESEAHLQNSFYGLLGKSENYQTLSERGEGMADFVGEIAMTERVVGVLTGVIKNNLSYEDFYSGMKNMLDAYGEQMPDWLTESFVVNVQERMRQLLGRWNATPFGEVMELAMDFL